MQLATTASISSRGDTVLAAAALPRGDSMSTLAELLCCACGLPAAAAFCAAGARASTDTLSGGSCGGLSAALVPLVRLRPPPRRRRVRPIVALRGERGDEPWLRSLAPLRIVLLRRFVLPLLLVPRGDCGGGVCIARIVASQLSTGHEHATERDTHNQHKQITRKSFWSFCFVGSLRVCVCVWAQRRTIITISYPMSTTTTAALCILRSTQMETQ